MVSCERFAHIMPLMTDDELTELRESIECSGQAQPIVLFQGKTLDGRNRVEACRQIGVKVDYTQTLHERDM
ncbi:MAG: hypothetical protein K9N51_02645 [Candidatus Pacebacteria bacterium]|nr:hypothetical protein [Candidatus Paceibacterota bacterium]